MSNLPNQLLTEQGKMPVLIKNRNDLVGTTVERDTFYAANTTLFGDGATWTNTTLGIKEVYDMSQTPAAWIEDINLDQGRLPVKENNASQIITVTANGTLPVNPVKKTGTGTFHFRIVSTGAGSTGQAIVYGTHDSATASSSQPTDEAYRLATVDINGTAFAGGLATFTYYFVIATNMINSRVEFDA